MKKFLIKSLIAAIVVFALATTLDRIICKGLLEMEDYRFQDWSAMLKGGMSNDILILGNSRGKSHFNTYVIDSLSRSSSFNIGIGGYPINVQLAKYQLYREHNAKPGIIIQNIDYLTLKDFPDIRNQHESEQFFPLVYDKGMREQLKELGYGFLDLNLPLYRFFGYQQVIKNGLLEAFHIKHYVSRPSYKGYLPEDGKWNGGELQKMSPEYINMSDGAKDLLESFLSQCRKDSIQVVLVNSPFFFGAQEKLIDYQDSRVYFEQVAKQYGCIYLDYTDTEISKETNYFCVSVHLNSKSAKLFTEILCNDLKSFGVIRD